MPRKDTLPLIDPKKLPDWSRGNLQLWGSPFVRKISEASAKISDPWREVKNQPCLKVWRVVKVRLVPWPDEEIGHFYDDDVFVILSIRSADVTSSELMIVDIHLWAGKHCTAAGYNVGVWKVLELDALLNHEALLHRDVNGRESELFKSYFNPITVWRGNGGSAYRYNKEDGYAARLLMFYQPDPRTNNLRVKEVSPTKSNLQTEHLYILDTGERLFLWVGQQVNAEEKWKAIKYCEEMCANRGLETTLEVVDESKAEGHTFSYYLQDYSETTEINSDDETAVNVTRQASLHKRGLDTFVYEVVKKNNKLSYKKLKEGMVRMGDLPRETVCIIDNGYECFVWIGNKANIEEKKYTLEYAHEYLKRTVHPLIQLTVLREGQDYPAFNRLVKPE